MQNHPTGGNQSTERSNNLPKVTQEVRAERGLKPGQSNCRAHTLHRCAIQPLQSRMHVKVIPHLLVHLVKPNNSPNNTERHTGVCVFTKETVYGSELFKPLSLNESTSALWQMDT